MHWSIIITQPATLFVHVHRALRVLRACVFGPAASPAVHVHGRSRKAPLWRSPLGSGSTPAYLTSTGVALASGHMQQLSRSGIFNPQMHQCHDSTHIGDNRMFHKDVVDQRPAISHLYAEPGTQCIIGLPTRFSK